VSEEGDQKGEAAQKQSVIAAVGGILGLISLFIGIFAAVPAVILGHIALVRVGQSAGRLGGRGLAVFALVTGYLGILLFALHLLRS
jgi:membrane-associated protease RseP (regulator of RpoE activity)